MTREELREIYYLNKEIIMWQKELAKLQCQSLIKGQEMTGMPRSNKGPTDNVGEMVVRVADIEFVIEGKLREIQLQRKRVMDFINSVEDSLIRQVMFYRHISLMNWNEVADNIGGGNSSESLRKIHDRFLE